MVITIDIGNTNVTFGVFKESQLIFVSRIATDDKKTEDQYAVEFRNILLLNDISIKDIEGCILCSVVPNLMGVIKKAVGILGISLVLTVSPGVKTGINIKTDNPKQTGTDIVCGAVWVKSTGKLPAIIVDMGTATTISAIDEKGELVGYSIMPGMEISLQALREHAAQLPTVSLDSFPNNISGKNTVDAMVSGIIYGTACAVDGMIKNFKEQFCLNATVFLTGGLGEKIAPYLESEVVAEKNAVLKGLYLVWKKNHS